MSLLSPILFLLFSAVGLAFVAKVTKQEAYKRSAEKGLQYITTTISVMSGIALSGFIFACICMAVFVFQAIDIVLRGLAG